MNDVVHIESLARCSCGDEFYLQAYVHTKPPEDKVIALQTHFHGNNVPMTRMSLMGDGTVKVEQVMV